MVIVVVQQSNSESPKKRGSTTQQLDMLKINNANKVEQEGIGKNNLVFKSLLLKLYQQLQFSLCNTQLGLKHHIPLTKSVY